ncbi:MAG TPA: hypothetical protein PKI20_02360 [Verrucomicrobiota bacterium]|jgi:mRNA-degrading endonuclease RelE of RelBE toxin-antitoxin system|nr:hypothetical protein [Verrucomicrobiota bacterium]HQL76681.1 hypothetical protein [Verrucomicrobiota bacterium]
MSPYRVFIAAEVIATLRGHPRREQQIITRLFDELAQDPSRPGDYAEQDEIGRPIQVAVIGNAAVCYWVDHAVKEVKIIDLKSAGG